MGLTKIKPKQLDGTKINNAGGLVVNASGELVVDPGDGIKLDTSNNNRVTISIHEAIAGSIAPLGFSGGSLALYFDIFQFEQDVEGKVQIAFAGSEGEFGTSNYPARYDHTHSDLGSPELAPHSCTCGSPVDLSSIFDTIENNSVRVSINGVMTKGTRTTGDTVTDDWNLNTSTKLLSFNSFYDSDDTALIFLEGIA